MDEEYFCDGCRHWKSADEFDIDEGMCISCLEAQMEENDDESTKELDV